MKRFIDIGVIFRSFGLSITFVGIFMLTAIPFAIYYQEETIPSILISSGCSILFGQILTVFNRKSKLQAIGDRESFIIVTLTWFMMGFFGSLPFLISGSIPNFTDAYFETISGFTTTGASILQDVEVLPKSILYWRSLTHWMGGLGILVLVIAILPNIGFGGVRLFANEAPGGSTGGKLHPRIRQTAMRLWFVYAFLTLLLVLLLMLGKMNFFESVCHAMGTLATGGFSTRNSSIGGYSPYIQIVITIFMFFGGVNFTLHYFLLKGKFKKVFYNEEWLKFVGFITIISLGVSFIVFFDGNYDSYPEVLRHSFFQCVSIITATGFATADYNFWPHASWIFIFLLFFTGGMIGSTAGGTKFTRHLVLFKNLRAEIKRLIHPRAIISIQQNNVTVSDDISRNFFIIFIAYLLVFITGSLLMSLFVEHSYEAFGTTVSCLGGVGPAFGLYGPVGNYSMIPNAGKWILSIIMVIGRLEVIPVLIFFHYAFWKK